MIGTQGPEKGVSLEEEARARVSRLVSGEATVTDLEEAKSWRGQSALHEAAFVEAARLWARLGPAGANVLTREGAPMAVSRRPKHVSRRLLLGGGAALASAAIYAVLRPPFGLWPSLSELRADYRTATGEQRRIETPNGALVEMNTATSLNLRPTSQGMRIELIAGEMAIATASRITGAVVVVAENGRISASAAKFNVRLQDASVCVSCLDGSVQVEIGPHLMNLKVSQQINYASDEFGAPVSIDSTLVSAWQTGLLIFHDVSVAHVVAEINRYRPGRIVLLNAELGRRLVNARFHITHVDEILTLVQRVFDARVERLPGGLVFLS